MRVVTVAQMKQIEKLADANGVSYYQMMENAGTAAYHILRQRVPHAKHIAVVAGKGNNGGDGFVMARLAAQDGLSVTVVLAEGEPVTRDAKTNYALLHALPVTIQTADTVRSIHADVVVDALYGTGFHGSLRPCGQKACDFMRTSGAYVLALDVRADCRRIPELRQMARSKRSVRSHLIRTNRYILHRQQRRFAVPLCWQILAYRMLVIRMRNQRHPAQVRAGCFLLPYYFTAFL